MGVRGDDFVDFVDSFGVDDDKSDFRIYSLVEEDGVEFDLNVLMPNGNIEGQRFCYVLGLGSCGVVVRYVGLLYISIIDQASYYFGLIHSVFVELVLRNGSVPG